MHCTCVAWCCSTKIPAIAVSTVACLRQLDCREKGSCDARSSALSIPCSQPAAHALLPALPASAAHSSLRIAQRIPRLWALNSLGSSLLDSAEHAQRLALLDEQSLIAQASRFFRALYLRSPGSSNADLSTVHNLCMTLKNHGVLIAAEGAG